MTQDDSPVGRLLSRRQALALLGATGGAVMAAARTTGAQAGPPVGAGPSCVARPAQEEGPYFVDEHLNRSDIRVDPTNGSRRLGVPLRLDLQVYRIGAASCAPLQGAVVDIWQCDAFGAYSDVEDPLFSTRGQKFLRGYQMTDASGVARFLTIYPGWYPTRTVHIHFKIRTDPFAARGQEFVSQLYFDDALTDRVHGLSPYVSRGLRRVKNRRDSIFLRGGPQLLLDPKVEGDGYAATFGVGLTPA